MKCLGLVAIVFLLVMAGCNLSDPANEFFAGNEFKNGEIEKTVTVKVNGMETIHGQPELGTIVIVPGLIEVSQFGYMTGFNTIIGKIVPEESTYEIVDWGFAMTDKGPEVYTKAVGKVTGNRGDSKFYEGHLWTYPAMDTSEGYVNITGGTGRFDGASGTLDLLDIVRDPVNNSTSWKVSGGITMVKDGNPTF